MWAVALLALAATSDAAEPDDEEALPPQQALERALEESVRASCPKLRYRIDPGLTAAARQFADAVEQGRAAPTDSALMFFASLETVEPVPLAGVATVETGWADRAVGDLYSRSCRFDRVGMAAARYRDRAVVALLTQRHQIEMSAIPSEVKPGTRVAISGRLPHGFKNARFFHLRPTGFVDVQPQKKEAGVAPLPEGRFLTTAAFDETGEHVVELLADGHGGPEVLAIKRVFVGVARPSTPPPDLPDLEGPGLDAVAAAIGALRAARGLPPLIRDAALDAIANGHSVAMAKTRSFAHVLPLDGTLEDRLYDAGYAYRFAAENIGLADDEARAHQAIALSPAHLANLLDPRHKRYGLGSAAGLSPEGTHAVYLTEVFANPVVGLADPADAVLKEIAAERMRRALPPLMRDPRLDALAEKEVRVAAFDGTVRVRPEVVSRARDTTQYLTTEAQLSVGSSVEEIRAVKAVQDAGWTHVGIGAMYANSKAFGPGRLWVLLVFAR
jgi:uncharacterized protein YkwD